MRLLPLSFIKWEGVVNLFNRLKSFLFGMLGVLVAIIIVSVVGNGVIDWGTIGALFTLIFLIFLFRLGLHLYKK